MQDSMQRRDFLTASARLLYTVPFFPIDRFALFNLGPTMDKEVTKLKIGKFDCTVFRDLLFSYQANDFFINAGPQELQQALSQYRIPTGRIPSPFVAILLQHDDQKILIDTGIGFTEKPVNVRGNSMMFKGRLHQLLQQENIPKETITDVIITHFHPDHIGGIFAQGQQLNFPNARFHMHQDEWEYWHSSQADTQPDQFKFFLKNHITPLKDGNLHLIKGDFETLLPGITAVKAPGHTPGQIALIIQSDKEHLLYISDAFLHPLHIERLDWQTNYDLDQAKAKLSRVKLLELAHQEHMLVNAFHFEFPGLGRIDKAGAKWSWSYQNQ